MFYFSNGYQAQQQSNNFSLMTMGGLAPASYISYPPYNQWPPEYQVPQFYPNNQFENLFLGYGGMNEPQPSPFFATMAREHLTNASTRQF
jgi:hypothetical protein